MYDSDYADKLERLENVIREYWDYLSYELQNKITAINKEYE